jgi:hypothetical protein
MQLGAAQSVALLAYMSLTLATPPDNDYAQVLRLSLLFYEAQGSAAYGYSPNVDGCCRMQLGAARSVALLAYMSLTLATPPDHDYAQVLRLSLLFYEAQRSGPLPSSNRIPWRSDSALQDMGQDGEDLTGGYYDGKWTFNWTRGWGLIHTGQTSIVQI